MTAPWRPRISSTPIVPRAPAGLGRRDARRGRRPARSVRRRAQPRPSRRSPRDSDHRGAASRHDRRPCAANLRHGHDNRHNDVHHSTIDHPTVDWTAPTVDQPTGDHPTVDHQHGEPSLAAHNAGRSDRLSRALPAAYGPRGATLLAQLQDIQSINPRKKGGRSRRAAAATTTIDNIDNWLGDGSLAPAVAHQAQDLLQPLTT